MAGCGARSHRQTEIGDPRWRGREIGRAFVTTRVEPGRLAAGITRRRGRVAEMSLFHFINSLMYLPREQQAPYTESGELPSSAISGPVPCVRTNG
jgi:hypothetical protein